MTIVRQPNPQNQECHRKTCCEWDKHRTWFPSARKSETAFKGWRSETTFVLSSYHLSCSPITAQRPIDVRIMSEIRLPTTPNVVSGIQRIFFFLPWQPRRSSTTHDRGRDFFVASASTTCVQDIQNVDTRGSWREWQAKWRIRSTRTSSITSTAVTASPERSYDVQLYSLPGWLWLFFVERWALDLHNTNPSYRSPRITTRSRTRSSVRRIHSRASVQLEIARESSLWFSLSICCTERR